MISVCTHWGVVIPIYASTYVFFGYLEVGMDRYRVRVLDDTWDKFGGVCRNVHFDVVHILPRSMLFWF